MIGRLRKLGLLGLIGVLGMMSGCKSREYVPLQTERTEREDVVREVYDTIKTTEKRLIYVRGDTLVDIRCRDRWRNVYRHDTMWYARTDSVPVPFPVERRLTKWEQFKIDCSLYVITALMFGLMIVIWLVRRRGR